LILSVAGFFLIRELFPDNKTVLIDLNGKPAFIFPLNEDRTIPVEGPAGKTFVQIRGSKVRIVDSPCPNKLCVKQGWIDKGVLVCLPNRVIVTLRGRDGDNGEIDAVTR